MRKHPNKCLAQEPLCLPECCGQVAVDFARQALDLIPLSVQIILEILHGFVAIPVKVEVFLPVVRVLNVGAAQRSDQWRW